MTYVTMARPKPLLACFCMPFQLAVENRSNLKQQSRLPGGSISYGDFHKLENSHPIRGGWLN